MKYRKIFTFILLLCTIFVTLLFINPNVSATTESGVTAVEDSAPTDLTNTIWQFYNTIDFIGSERFDTYYINFTDNSQNQYESIAIINGQFYGTYINYDNIAVYDTSSWVNENYTIINIIDGADVSNSDLIDFMLTNARLIPPTEPTYTISGQYQFNEEITWLYDTSEQEGILYLPFYVYNLDNPTRVNYDYMLNQNREDLGINYFLYANETDSVTFIGQYAGRFTTSTIINMYGDERIIYFYTAEVSEGVYIWLNENGRFINDPTLDPNNPDNPDSGNNPNNPNNPDFGTDTVRQIVNQVNAFLGIQILPGLSFRDILLICIALPLLMYILKVFLGG